MPKPKCAVCVTFTIKEKHIAEFHRAVQLQAKNSLEKEAWCHQFDVSLDPEKPNQVLLYETYDDRAAFENKHRKTDHFAQFASTIADWVESKQIGVWDIQETTAAR